MKRTIEIVSTTDYGIFKRLKGNRDVTNKRVAIIKDSIMSIGYISNPIIVNEDMEVIDGQGRLEALKQLSMEVEYRIIKGLGINECRAMNLKPTGWSINDFVDSYAEYGNENYMRLKELHNKHDFGYTLLYSLVKHLTKNGRSSQEDLRLGTFELTPEEAEATDKLCEYLNEFSDIQKKIGGKQDLFYGVVGRCAMQPKVDRNRLNVSLHQQHGILSPFAKSEIALKEISDAYNKGYGKSNRRYFDYEWKTKEG